MKKILVITGASKGIGLASAKLFQSHGYRIINLSRSACRLNGVTNIGVDLLNRDWAQECQMPLLQGLEGANQIVLIHNAAMMLKDTAANVDAQQLSQLLQLNVVAPAELTTLLLPLMRETIERSSILYVGSTLGTKAVANTYSYVVSKHAVIGQMRATCQDLAGSRVHTACVCPGFTATEMLQDHLGQNPELHDEIVANVAQKRLIKPSEIADTLWFCSQNSVINGSVVHANLGQIEQ